VRAENNLSYRTKTGGFHQHYGKQNVVRNNIFAFDKSAQIARTRREEHLSFTFERNLVYWRDAALLRGDWSDNFVMDRNLYWDASGKEPKFLDLTLAEWQAKGRDKNSLIADPMFVNAAKDDFRLRLDSPAAKIGFVPFDLGKAGRLTKSRAAATRMPPRAFPPPPPPAPPSPIADGFEETPVGDRPVGVTLIEEADVPRAVIRVTDETAPPGGGRRSLKFSDAPGQKASYNPHLFYRPGFTRGVLVGRFALRMEPGAVLSHEWRTAGSPYQTGPSIRVEADGTLTSGNKPLTRLPHGKWVTIEITCGLGASANGIWSLRVALPGRQPPQQFDDLPCSPDFKTLGWYGFVADGQEAGVFYLDNVALAPRDK